MEPLSHHFGPELWQEKEIHSLEKVSGHHEGCCEEIEVIFEWVVLPGEF